MKSLPTVEEAGTIAVEISEPLDAREQAFFVAGFQEAIKYLNNMLTVSGGGKPMNNEITQARPPEYGGATGSTLQHLRLHNPIVAQIMRAGGTAEDCAVALAASNDRLVDRLMTLEGIAPRRIKLPDGRVDTVGK